MRAHKSKTVSGGPCTKPRHWCRESRSVSIFFVLDGADGMAARTAGAAMNPENRRKKSSSSSLGCPLYKLDGNGVCSGVREVSRGKPCLLLHSPSNPQTPSFLFV